MKAIPVPLQSWYPACRQRMCYSGKRSVMVFFFCMTVSPKILPVLGSFWCCTHIWGGGGFPDAQKKMSSLFWFGAWNLSCEPSDVPQWLSDGQHQSRHSHGNTSHGHVWHRISTKHARINAFYAWKKFQDGVYQLSVSSRFDPTNLIKFLMLYSPVPWSLDPLLSGRRLFHSLLGLCKTEHSCAHVCGENLSLWPFIPTWPSTSKTKALIWNLPKNFDGCLLRMVFFIQVLVSSGQSVCLYLLETQLFCSGVQFPFWCTKLECTD